jgi:hypothetical protein
MRILAVILVVFIFLGCVTTAVKEDTTVGFYNYTPVIQKVMADRKAAGNEEALTEQEVLSIITGIKNEIEKRGAEVIGIEANGTRVWFKAPIQ